ncbi:MULTISPECIES: RluA family pseudouridine synthase [unclassified Enterococcus]|uniref:RluA family pseudouridine synthase n=1 Tax=unclassified Enterococcus TaxID=2608891 RepID=UPI001CE1D469|nr:MULTISPECIES: RluA family pseudouridine synthase [unclassified Enterococcus]MCA5012025.1 RluA family pseudouridine synthase [Enterococcus sp. S23]MCA5015276.1 RluA family pseudouridine synthase [Enterococcus sp. S22(2020)]
MELSILLPETFKEQTIRELLEQEWLVPRKVRHFLRIRKNVSINDKPALFHFTAKAGDKITLNFEADDYPMPKLRLGNPANVHVLFEDEHLIILNKPAGMKTHPNQPDEQETLLNHLAAYLAPKNQVPYVVHRLDKETSGAILFAKNPFVLPILGRLLEKKEIYRRYQAIVSGALKETSFTIRKKIGRNRHDRRKRVIDEHKGDVAITHVEAVSYSKEKNQTLIYCVLETGRTHQIRVHLQSIGHPIIGDPLYHPKPKGRLMLHAYELHLVHPFSGETIVATAEPGIE